MAISSLATVDLPKTDTNNGKRGNRFITNIHGRENGGSGGWLAPAPNVRHTLVCRHDAGLSCDVLEPFAPQRQTDEVCRTFGTGQDTLPDLPLSAS